MRNNERWWVLLDVLVLPCELTKSQSSSQLQEIKLQFDSLVCKLLLWPSYPKLNCLFVTTVRRISGLRGTKDAMGEDSGSKRKSDQQYKQEQNKIQLTMRKNYVSLLKSMTLMD